MTNSLENMTILELIEYYKKNKKEIQEINKTMNENKKKIENLISKLHGGLNSREKRGKVKIE